MKQEKPFYKKWWFWVLVFFFLLVMGNLNTGKKTPADPTPNREEQKEVVEAPQESEEPQTIEAQITSIIDSLHFKYSDLQIQDNGSSIMITLHYDQDSWDETRFCSDCLTDYINLCKEAYSIDGIDKVEYYIFVNMIDAKGNETSQKGFAICMAKDVFNTYNWDNLAFMPDSYKQISSDCELFDIHAGIAKNVDFSKVFYKG